MILHDRLKAMLALRCKVLDMSDEHHSNELSKYGYDSIDELDMHITEELVQASGFATTDLDVYEPILPIARKS